MTPPTIRYRTTHPPGLGEWVRSTRRPRYAYLVVGIKDLGPDRRYGRVGVGGAHVYKLTVERRPATSPGENETVHPIHWDHRGKK